jgi:hypothetical protein
MQIYYWNAQPVKVRFVMAYIKPAKIIEKLLWWKAFEHTVRNVIEITVAGQEPFYIVSVLYDVADFQHESPIRSTKVELSTNV